MKVLEKGFTNRQYAEQAIRANKENKVLNFAQDGTVHMEDKPIRQLNYAQLRQQEYEPLENQLDLLYWDKINGTTLWQDSISAIKAKYPKEA